MENINIKSEFTDEMEERYTNYDMNENAGNDIRVENENIKYDLTDEYEMENRNEIMYHLNAGSEMDDGNNIQCDSNAENPVQSGDINVPKNNLPATNVIDGGNVKFEFTAGYRRNSVLIYLVDEKQLFTKKYAHNHLDRYTCYTKSCKASLLFDTYLNKIVKLYHTFHLHPDQSDVYKKMKVLNEMKDYCLTNDGSNLTTKEIFDRKCNVMKEAAHLVEYNKIKRNLNRLKKNAMQKPAVSDGYENMMLGINDVAGTTNDCASKWDTKSSNSAPPLRVSSPISSDADSTAAASISSLIEKTATSTPGPSKSKSHKPPFKKIKLTHDVPFTEGYLENDTPFELKTSQIRKSPLRPNPRVLYQEEGNHICSSCPCIAAQENEYDKIAKAWASELKLMTTEQQIFAKRAIAEIIFEGQLGSLSRNSVHIRQQNPTNEADPFDVENIEYVCEKSESHTEVI